MDDITTIYYTWVRYICNIYEPALTGVEAFAFLIWAWWSYPRRYSDNTHLVFVHLAEDEDKYLIAHRKRWMCAPLRTNTRMFQGHTDDKNICEDVKSTSASSSSSSNISKHTSLSHYLVEMREVTYIYMRRRCHLLEAKKSDRLSDAVRGWTICLKQTTDFLICISLKMYIRKQKKGKSVEKDSLKVN